MIGNKIISFLECLPPILKPYVEKYTSYDNRKIRLTKFDYSINEWKTANQDNVLYNGWKEYPIPIECLTPEKRNYIWFITDDLNYPFMCLDFINWNTRPTDIWCYFGDLKILETKFPSLLKKIK